jgi:hypothetical protein
MVADLYHVIEKLTMDLREIKGENDQLRQMILQMKN